MIRVVKRLNKKAALREESMQRLSDAAFQVFVNKGYHASTLQEIAESVGLTKGAIFFYFESKEKLLLHLLEIAEANIVDSLFSHLAGIRGNALDKLVGYYHFGSMHGIERPYQLLCLIQTSIEFRHRADPIGRRIVAIYSRIYRVLEDVIDQGKNRGVLSKTVATREFASMMIATHDGMMLEWWRRGKNQIDGRILVETVRDTMLHGIATDAMRPTKRGG